MRKMRQSTLALLVESATCKHLIPESRPLAQVGQRRTRSSRSQFTSLLKPNTQFTSSTGACGPCPLISAARAPLQRPSSPPALLLTCPGSSIRPARPPPRLSPLLRPDWSLCFLTCTKNARCEGWGGAFGGPGKGRCLQHFQCRLEGGGGRLQRIYLPQPSRKLWLSSTALAIERER